MLLDDQFGGNHVSGVGTAFFVDNQELKVALGRTRVLLLDNW